MDDQHRYFLCTGYVARYADLHKHPRAHIIGHLTTLTDEGRKVSVLALWETSMPTDCVPSIEPLVRVYLVGDARQIRCGLCERKERWEIGKAAFLALMSKFFDERMRDVAEV